MLQDQRLVFLMVRGVELAVEVEAEGFLGYEMRGQKISVELEGKPEPPKGGWVETRGGRGGRGGFRGGRGGGR